MIILGSLIVTGLLLAALAAAFQHAIGTNFLYVAGAGYWAGLDEGKFNGVFLWPNILAMALGGQPDHRGAHLAFGYILNSFQIVNNCYIGMTRVMVAMSLDRLLPEWVSRVSDRLHTPVNAHLAYFLASIPVILVYNLWSSWTALTLGVTFACGYVFIVTALAGALMPYRAKALYDASPGAVYKLGNIPLVTIFGLIGAIVGAIMVLMFMFSSALGLTSVLAYQVVFGVLAVSIIWYFLAKDDPALTRHQRGLCLQGDTARVVVADRLSIWRSDKGWHSFRGLPAGGSGANCCAAITHAIRHALRPQVGYNFDGRRSASTSPPRRLA